MGNLASPVPVMTGYPGSYVSPPSRLPPQYTNTAVRSSIHRNPEPVYPIAAGYPTNATVVRVEERPQVIYHQPIDTIMNNTTPIGVPASAVTTSLVNAVLPPPPRDVPVTSRPVNQARAPVRRSAAMATAGGCPWWCWLIVGLLVLLVLAGVLAGLYFHLTNNTKKINKGGEVAVGDDNKGEDTATGDNTENTKTETNTT